MASVPRSIIIEGLKARAKLSIPTQELISVIVTTYNPVSSIEIVCVVAEFDHWKDSKFPASRVVDPPSQIVSSCPRSTIGSGFMLRLWLALPWQLFPSVTTTE